jgi:hypothetical protein
MKRLFTILCVTLLTACKETHKQEIVRPEPYHSEPAIPAGPNPDWYVSGERTYKG